jgi:hypothetical protein
MRVIGLVALLSLVLAPLAVDAQPASKTPRIGVLVPGSQSLQMSRTSPHSVKDSATSAMSMARTSPLSTGGLTVRPSAIRFSLPN